MKFALGSLALLISSHAFAYGAHDMYFTCTSAHAKIYVGIERSEADGVSVTEVKLQGRTIESEIKQNTQEGADVAPTRIAFSSRGHVVSLRTSKDMIETSLNGGAARLTIDGKAELMKCVP